MYILKLIASLLMIAVITGCSHSIKISPELSTLRGDNANKSDTAVGYYISKVDMVTEVKTPGGGGDDVTYFPYKDTEAAIKTILSQKFKKVYSLKSKKNDPLIKDKNISLVFYPKIKTDSSSSSALTWPPTDFTVELSCKAIENNGKTIWKKTVTGKGHAEFSEFKSNFSLSAQRASEEAFKLMRDEIFNAKELK